MKSETLNGVLTYVLGVLVVLAVYFALRTVFITREARSLSSQALLAGNKIAQTQAILNDAQIYNQKYQDPALTQIFKAAAKPANH